LFSRKQLSRSPVAQALFSLVVVALAAATVGGVWYYLENPQKPPAWDGHLQGVTYSGYREGQSPLTHTYPTDAQVTQDLQLLSGVTDHIRTYASAQGPDVPALAAPYGLTVTAGADITNDDAHSQRELEALWEDARRYPNVNQLVVGNETQLRGDVGEKALIEYIDETRQNTGLPTSTAEPWHIWLKHPELAEHVDFIAVHLLPYWERLSIEQAVPFTLNKLEEMKRTFPGKRIVITETGWPSHGDTKMGAVASPQNESVYLREFVAKAKALDIEFFIIEGFDVRWKLTEEGRAGGYWGVFNDARALKISKTSTVYMQNDWLSWASHAFLVSVVPIYLLCLLCFRMHLVARYGLSVSLFAASAFMTWYSHSFSEYYTLFDMKPLQLVLEVIAGLCTVALLVQLFEAAETLGLHRWQRQFGVRRLRRDQEEPLVSIHLACANEPPEMVILTLESLARLRWANLEIVVVDNNTKDEAKWRPVQEWVAQHAERFKFFHLPHCPGFKAGALNHALKNTHPDAAVIGVVDADYIVSEDWLQDLMGHFNQAAVSVVQSPQAHRDFEDDWLPRAANYEFEGFFRIGMHHRNERDAIIQHGTMTLVRAATLRAVGGWSEWTICEDAELGLRLMMQRTETRYIDRVYGRGLTPTTFASLKNQRRRWALGAMQILKGHWANLVRPGSLTLGQQFHFLTGWLPWICEALQLLCTLASLVWTVGMLAFPKYFEPPIPSSLTMLFVTPIIRFVLGLILYRARVDCNWKDTLSAALTSMALNHSVARGVFAGLFGRNAKFIVTNKGKVTKQSWIASAREEGFIAGGLLFGALATVFSYGVGSAEALKWAIALGTLSMPYLSAVVVAWVANCQPAARPLASIQPVTPASPGSPACNSLLTKP